MPRRRYRDSGEADGKHYQPCTGAEALWRQAADRGDTIALGNLAELREQAGSTHGRYAGTWTNYPYYPSGNIVVFTIEGGLSVVKSTFAT